MELREFRRKHGERTRLWQIWVKGDTVHTCYGWQGGAINGTEDTPGSSNRETAEERAISRANKLAKDKLNKGYTEYVPGTEIVVGDVAGTEVTFDGPPPDGFEMFKPKTMPKKGSSEGKKMEAVIGSGSEVITRKYNGMKHLLSVTSDHQYILRTRRKEDATAHYPHLIDEFRKLNIPSRSIVAVELFVPGDDPDGPEDFRAMQALSRSKPERAVQLQLDNPAKMAQAVLLAPAYWRGQPILKQMRVFDWMGVLERVVCDGRKRIGKPKVHAMRVFYGGLHSAVDYLERTGIEGLVIYNGEDCFGEKGFNFRAKSDRPDAWKYKRIREEDFLAVWDPQKKSMFPEGGTYGTGKNQSLPKSLALYQFDKRGQPVYVSNVGTGMKDGDREFIAYPVHRGMWWEGVVTVEFTERNFIRQGDDSNALTFASFQKFHEDKSPRECVNEKL